ncbi:unnamed protein product [Ostreobium quekettii]|uniref:Uncharacterized protein n=1 Tax=Ostreobium quekettii TaxID=121088 RepID=A0A8S1JFI8_9CHLO|nr:unnamed protein product [Ostreobium quekettii]
MTLGASAPGEVGHGFDERQTQLARNRGSSSATLEIFRVSNTADFVVVLGIGRERTWHWKQQPLERRGVGLTTPNTAGQESGFIICNLGNAQSCNTADVVEDVINLFNVSVGSPVLSSNKEPSWRLLLFFRSFWEGGSTSRHYGGAVVQE